MIRFHQLKFCILLGSLTLTLLNNTVLMILVITKSPQKLGNYKHLMCYFSVLSIVFAFFEFMVQPYVHCDAGFVLIMNMQDTVFEVHPKISMVFLACASACFHATVFAIAINFIYRYFAIQRVFPTEHDLPDSTTAPVISLIPFSVVPEFELTRNKDNGY
ncbi:unnamed protein product [Caenorhabditis brenneri]